MLAAQAMRQAIMDRAIARPENACVRNITKRQREIVERFRAEMASAGGLLPEWWKHSTPDEIADAAIQAVRRFGVTK